MLSKRVWWLCFCCALHAGKVGVVKHTYLAASFWAFAGGVDGCQVYFFISAEFLLFLLPFGFWCILDISYLLYCFCCGELIGKKSSGS